MIDKDYKCFKIIYNEQKLSHHPFKRMFFYLNWCFKGIDFRNKDVLDIGGGNGIFSYYAKYLGAKEVINLEPFSDGMHRVGYSLTPPHEPINAIRTIKTCV